MQQEVLKEIEFGRITLNNKKECPICHKHKKNKSFEFNKK
jgi:hypothetical protein